MSIILAAGRRSRRAAVTGIVPPSLPVRALKGVVLLVCCAVVILPFMSVISTSLAGQQEISEAGGLVLWPRQPSLDAYRAIFAGGVVTRALLVSIGITVVGSLLSLTATACLAYSLSRPGSFAHRPLLLTVLFTLLFSPGIIPSYLIVKQLGLLDSYWSLILPVLVNGFNVVVMRAFFMDLPRELIDSARIDGAGELQIMLRVVVPLSKAVLAVVGLFYAVAYWNSFFTAMLYINDTSKWPLQLVLRTYVVDNAALGADQLNLAAELPPPQQALQMAILVVSLVPILLVYPFLQRHFAKGVLLGAVKG
ncbi:multiple sugar transport system permease protein/putative aldouronate transport system permease protein [Thermocatellispora tengchongensis]|uniref:Multiple sugar transport system permease protein/putative aldouronate transport system permease protein n=1 Tax=Thermocatellispora tengchongensis TaxID=1073253 RepID=A0A840NY29_9ACTN|nr:carbohydrate ABC transporter permease [Thermocatellispora tengchongensis]MBB5133784.1 multiple sugar transport system permease protein/putative aldouronate transport system permease protein [Thermocatellispora tengchongensis]